MHNNYWKCNHETKEELSTDIDAGPCNMASEGNNIFPRRLSVNVKEASGILRTTLWWANKVAQMCTRSLTYITSRVKGKAIICEPKIAQKILFYGKTIFYRKIHFSYPSSPLSESKSWQWPKVNLETVKWTINKH